MIKNWIMKLVGKWLAKKIDLMEDTKVDTKKWWQSKTVLSGIVAVLVGTYNLVGANLAPSFGWHLPAIPEFVFTILGAIGIYGRVTADKTIG